MNSPDEVTAFQRHLMVWRRTFKQIGRHNGMATAGNMAFLTMLSMFPFIIFLVALSGFLGQTDRGLDAINYMFEVLPPEVSAVIAGPVNGIIKNTGAEVLTGSILFAVWTAANGVDAARDILIGAFGKGYARPIWARRLESLAIVIFGAATLILAMSILVLGPALYKAASVHFPDAVSTGVDTVWGYLQLLISPSILFIGLYSVYLTLTPRRVKNASRIPGTLFCMFILLATANGLSVYLKYAGNYDITYGSLAGVVILQLFCFFVSIGFVVGAELNASFTAVNKNLGRKTSD